MPEKRIIHGQLTHPRRLPTRESGGGVQWAPIERQRGGQLDHANAEIIQIARGMLRRIEYWICLVESPALMSPPFRSSLDGLRAAAA